MNSQKNVINSRLFYRPIDIIAAFSFRACNYQLINAAVACADFGGPGSTGSQVRDRCFGGVQYLEDSAPLLTVDA